MSSRKKTKLYAVARERSPAASHLLLQARQAIRKGASPDTATDAVPIPDETIPAPLYTPKAGGIDEAAVLQSFEFSDPSPLGNLLKDYASRVIMMFQVGVESGTAFADSFESFAAVQAPDYSAELKAMSHLFQYLYHQLAGAEKKIIQASVAAANSLGGVDGGNPLNSRLATSNADLLKQKTVTGVINSLDQVNEYLSELATLKQLISSKLSATGKTIPIELVRKSSELWSSTTSTIEDISEERMKVCDLDETTSDKVDQTRNRAKQMAFQDQLNSHHSGGDRKGRPSGSGTSTRRASIASSSHGGSTKEGEQYLSSSSRRISLEGVLPIPSQHPSSEGAESGATGDIGVAATLADHHHNGIRSHVIPQQQPGQIFKVPNVKMDSSNPPNVSSAEPIVSAFVLQQPAAFQQYFSTRPEREVIPRSIAAPDILHPYRQPALPLGETEPTVPGTKVREQQQPTVAQGLRPRPPSDEQHRRPVATSESDSNILRSGAPAQSMPPLSHHAENGTDAKNLNTALLGSGATPRRTVNKPVGALGSLGCAVRVAKGKELGIDLPPRRGHLTTPSQIRVHHKLVTGEETEEEMAKLRNAADSTSRFQQYSQLLQTYTRTDGDTLNAMATRTAQTARLPAVRVSQTDGRRLPEDNSYPSQVGRSRAEKKRGSTADQSDRRLQEYAEQLAALRAEYRSSARDDEKTHATISSESATEQTLTPHSDPNPEERSQLAAVEELKRAEVVPPRGLLPKNERDREQELRRRVESQLAPGFKEVKY